MLSYAKVVCMRQDDVRRVKYITVRNGKYPYGNGPIVTSTSDTTVFYNMSGKTLYMYNRNGVERQLIPCSDNAITGKHYDWLKDAKGLYVETIQAVPTINKTALKESGLSAVYSAYPMQSRGEVDDVKDPAQRTINDPPTITNSVKTTCSDRIIAVVASSKNDYNGEIGSTGSDYNRNNHTDKLSAIGNTPNYVVSGNKARAVIKKRMHLPHINMDTWYEVHEGALYPIDTLAEDGFIYIVSNDSIVTTNPLPLKDVLYFFGEFEDRLDGFRFTGEVSDIVNDKDVVTPNVSGVEIKIIIGNSDDIEGYKRYVVYGDNIKSITPIVCTDHANPGYYIKDLNTNDMTYYPLDTDLSKIKEITICKNRDIAETFTYSGICKTLEEKYKKEMNDKRDEIERIKLEREQFKAKVDKRNADEEHRKWQEQVTYEERVRKEDAERAKTDHDQKQKQTKMKTIMDIVKTVSTVIVAIIGIIGATLKLVG